MSDVCEHVFFNFCLLINHLKCKCNLYKLCVLQVSGWWSFECILIVNCIYFFVLFLFGLLAVFAQNQLCILTRWIG